GRDAPAPRRRHRPRAAADRVPALHPGRRHGRELLRAREPHQQPVPQLTARTEEITMSTHVRSPWRSRLLVACVLALGGATAHAGTGGSAARIQDAVHSGSQDAVLAEVERAENLICPDCTAIVTDLLDDERPAVREVAAWWFARRPSVAQSF